MELSLTNEKFKAEKITVLTTQNMYKKYKIHYLNDKLGYFKGV
jgi:hypothetical protein